MPRKRFRLAVCTGGGDCPGLNAVIHGIVKQAIGMHGMEMVGVRDGLSGLIADPPDVFPLDLQTVAGIHDRGGTILGTTNKGSPFRDKKQGEDILRCIARSWKKEKLDALIVIGGDGTQFMARTLSDRGFPVVGIPKTIDNDLHGSDEAIGFATAVDTAVDAAMRLQSSAEAHNRVMILEVMGRDAGHIALHTGIASAANVVLIPEIPFDYKELVQRLERRRSLGRDSYLMIIAEGACETGCSATFQESVSGTKLLGGVSHKVARELHIRTGVEARVTVLGHIQRGGTPNAHDRILASLLAREAVRRVAAGEFGGVVGIKNRKIVDLPYKQIKDRRRMVEKDSPFLIAAEAMGISFGRASDYEGAI